MPIITGDTDQSDNVFTGNVTTQFEATETVLGFDYTLDFTFE